MAGGTRRFHHWMTTATRTSGLRSRAAERKVSSGWRALAGEATSDAAAVQRAMAMLLLVLVAHSVIALDPPLPVRYPVCPATSPHLPGVASSPRRSSVPPARRAWG